MWRVSGGAAAIRRSTARPVDDRSTGTNVSRRNASCVATFQARPGRNTKLRERSAAFNYRPVCSNHKHFRSRSSLLPPRRRAATTKIFRLRRCAKSWARDCQHSARPHLAGFIRKRRTTPASAASLSPIQNLNSELPPKELRWPMKC